MLISQKTANLWASSLEGFAVRLSGKALFFRWVEADAKERQEPRAGLMKAHKVPNAVHRNAWVTFSGKEKGR